MKNEHHVYHSSEVFMVVGQTGTIARLLHRTHQSCRINLSEVTN